jgi:hypothetical protein
MLPNIYLDLNCSNICHNTEIFYFTFEIYNMIKSNNIKKTWLVAVFITTIWMGSIVTTQDNLAFAGGKHKKSNEAEQAISQIQGLKQTSGMSSGGDTLLSGNNLGFLLNLNEGNNALGQQ